MTGVQCGVMEKSNVDTVNEGGVECLHGVQNSSATGDLNLGIFLAKM